MEKINPLPPLSPFHPNPPKTEIFDFKQLENYIREVLDNFSYRYIQNDHSALPQSTSAGSSKDIIFSCAISRSLKESLSGPSENIRMKIIEEVRNRKGVGSPTVAFLIGAQILSHQQNGQGKLKVFAIINWNYPDHPWDVAGAQYQPHHQHREDTVVEYENHSQLKILFPQAMEKVCAIF